MFCVNFNDIKCGFNRKMFSQPYQITSSEHLETAFAAKM